jgi:hypothetical protein
MGTGAATFSSERGRTTKRFRAHWSVFAPTVLVGLIYGGLWVWLTVSGGGNGALARIAMLVLVIGVPILFVHAGLRFVTTRLRVGGTAVILRLGWPRRAPRRLRLRDIAGVAVKRGVIGRIVDTGTIILTRRNGERIVVPDIAGPDRVAEAMFSI